MKKSVRWGNQPAVDGAILDYEKSKTGNQWKYSFDHTDRIQCDQIGASVV